MTAIDDPVLIDFWIEELERAELPLEMRQKFEAIKTKWLGNFLSTKDVEFLRVLYEDYT